MGYDAPDLYNQPELFDLKPVGEVSWNDESYSFDFTVVWHHKDGSFYVATDSGCSCPAPFENFTSLSDAHHFQTADEVMEYLKDTLDKEAEQEWWVRDNAERAGAQVLDLTSKLVRMRATPQEIEQAIESIKAVVR